MEEKKQNNWSGWITLIILGLVGWGIYSLINSGSGDGSIDPYWQGTTQQYVCKKPYYNFSGLIEDQCVFTQVTNVNNTSVLVPNGQRGINSLSITQCYNDTNDNPFCRTLDAEGAQWDVMPARTLMRDY